MPRRFSRLPRFDPSISTCCSAWATTAYFASLFTTNPALHYSNPKLWAKRWRTTLGWNGVIEEGWGGAKFVGWKLPKLLQELGFGRLDRPFERGVLDPYFAEFFLDLQTTSFEIPWFLGVWTCFEANSWPLCWRVDLNHFMLLQSSGSTITTSAKAALNCGLVRESPQNPLNSGLGL